MSAGGRDQTDERTAAPSGRRWLVVPLVLFLALAGMFYFALYAGDPSKLPSALIGKPVPAFDLDPLDGLRRDGQPVPGFGKADLTEGRVSLVNIWASWCGPCRLEHPLLMTLQAQGIPVYGINYKDAASNARRFLGSLGNPYVAVGVDRGGRVAIDWGVYGVPETFVVDGKGRIAFKHVGPLTEEIVRDKLMPAIKAAGGS